MPINEYGMNDDFVNYFSLEEYISNIKLLPRLLEHLEDTNREFDEYMKKLSKYDEEYIVNYWIYLLYEELKSSMLIENLKYDDSLLGDDVLFDSFNITEKRIHTLHNFAVKDEIDPSFSYRNTDVNVSSFNKDGSQNIYWRGANKEDVNNFMNDFIKIYKQGGTSLLLSNPFLVSSLMHLLFVRIHPYSDGNGRTARLIHNIKFTESINKLYGTRLKLSPLNISKSILLNKITYNNCINNIYFDNEHDTNENINKWFDFVLNMVDEQLYFSNDKLDKMDRFDTLPKKKIDIDKMRLSKIKRL